MLRKWTELVDRISGYNPELDRDLLNKVYQFLTTVSLPADKAGEAVGLPFQSIAVANILADLKLDTASIAAGLLAESVRAKTVSPDQVRGQFGEDVAFLVERVARISLISPRVRVEQKLEELRKMVLAAAKDIRVVLIRLAMCLQQVRALAETDPAKPIQVAGEILDIYGPIAHRLGIHWIKSELEDLAFRLSRPQEFAELQTMVDARRQGGRDVVRKVVAFLKEKLRQHNIKGEVFGREKHLYSVWEKMHRKGVLFDDLYDLIAYRILVRKKSDCYRVLGMIHSVLKPIPGHFKDYIALPKSNGYQSLHTVVIGPYGNRIEIQIRTQKMHSVAESGVAAHWVYKGKGLKTKGAGATGYAWLKQLLEVHQNADDPRQFLENVKIDLFPDEIYLFTPRGDIVTLPRGGTVVDFAYAVHSDVGDHCQGGRVNGRMVPLKTALGTGDTVEILTGKRRHPSTNWLEFVVTGKAKYHIGRWIKEQQREQMEEQGRELLEREIKKAGHGAALTEKAMQKGAAAFHLPNCRELVFRVGLGEISPTQALHRMFPSLVAARTPRPEAGGVEEGVRPQPASAARKGEASNGLRALSELLGDMEVMVAKCCSPVPGDPIVGIIHSGQGVRIHAAGCSTLANYADQPQRRMEDLHWPSGTHLLFRARLRVMLRNEGGDGFSQVGQAVSDAKGRIVESGIQDRDRDPAQLQLTVEVRDQGHLEVILQHLRSIPLVLSVERLKG